MEEAFAGFIGVPRVEHGGEEGEDVRRSGEKERLNTVVF